MRFRPLRPRPEPPQGPEATWSYILFLEGAEIFHFTHIWSCHLSVLADKPRVASFLE